MGNVVSRLKNSEEAKDISYNLMIEDSKLKVNETLINNVDMEKNHEEMSNVINAYEYFIDTRTKAESVSPFFVSPFFIFELNKILYEITVSKKDETK